VRTYFDKRGLPAQEIQLLLFEIAGKRSRVFTWESLLSQAEDDFIDRKVNSWRTRYIELMVHQAFIRAFHSPRFKKDRAEFDRYNAKGECWACGTIVGYRADNGQWLSCLYIGHLVDRAEGGSNLPDNVRPMCGRCNKLKPFHQTKVEAYSWRDEVRKLDALKED
jgi:5-methylcytosine-specific restriction endonuclease McrA